METRDQRGNRVGQMDAYGNPVQQQQTDAYGNPVQQQLTDAYGNPIHQMVHGVPQPATYGHEVKDTCAGHGIGGGYGAGLGEQVQMMRPEEQHKGGVLRRSGSSSSSSEDDGMGGRRKKGLKEKVKEKLPGGHKMDECGQQQQHGYGQATMGYGGTTTTGVHREPEKKGMMEKIKEKLPGQH